MRMSKREYDAILDGKDSWKIIDQDGNIYLCDLSYERALMICESWNEQEYEDSTGYINPRGLPEGDTI
jgi:hypothetical protein